MGDVSRTISDRAGGTSLPDKRCSATAFLLKSRRSPPFRYKPANRVVRSASDMVSGVRVEAARGPVQGAHQLRAVRRWEAEVGEPGVDEGAEACVRHLPG